MSDRTLLLVDDERPILNALARLLRKESYRLQTAINADEALETMQRDSSVQVVASDYRMPGMTGIELLREIKHGHPNTVRVVLSGYADGHVVMDAINVGEVYRFLPKPWNDEELKVTLRQCFDRYDLLAENERLLGQVRAQNEALREVNDLLEQAVDDRTRSLQLSQEILEKLPMPVLGVSTDGTIALVNAAVDQLVPAGSPLPIGIHVREVFPGEIVRRIEYGLHGRTTSPIQPCTLNGKEFRLFIRILDGGGDVRGCTLILDAINDDDYSYSLRADSAAC